MPPPTTVTSTAVVDAEIGRLAAANRDAFDLLVQLADHPAHELLNRTDLHGPTLVRWTVGREQLVVLRALHERHTDALSAIRWIRGRTAALAPDDLVAVARILGGPRTALDPRSPDDLASAMAELDAGIRAVLDGVTRVHDTLAPRLDRCAAAGLPRERVDELRGELLADPLSFLDGDRVDSSAVESLERDCDQLAAAAGALVDLRRAADTLLDDAAAAAGRLDELTWQIVLCRAEVALAVRGGAPDAPSVRGSGEVRVGLARARELAAAGDWARFGTAIATVRASTTAALERVAAEIEDARGPLRDQAELRALLDLYRAKAVDGGRIGDLRLERAYRAAHDLLWNPPSDLDGARAALDSYRFAVNRRPDRPDRP